MAVLSGVNSLLAFAVFWILTPTGSWIFDLAVGAASLALSMFALVLLLKAARVEAVEMAPPVKSAYQEHDPASHQPCSLIEIERFVDQYPAPIQALILKTLEQTAEKGHAVTPLLLSQVGGVVDAAIQEHATAGDPNRTSYSHLSFVRRMRELRNL